MKRNYDLMRNILLDIENQESRFAEIKMEENETFSPDEMSYHINLLISAGLIEGIVYSNYTFNGNLTSKGHDFIDDAKNKTIWEQGKEFIKEKGGSVSLQVLSEVLKALTLKHLGLG